MPYIRRRGNQLALVHGVRDPETQKVEQQVLFTLYSKAEALEVLGRGSPDGAHAFQALLQEQYPDLRFDWKKTRRAIEREMAILPDLYPYKEERLKKRFHDRLVEFARELLFADPQHLHAAAGLVKEHAGALGYVSDLIAWRLRMSEKVEPSEWSADNRFFWRFALQGSGVPPEAEEAAADLFAQGELGRAEAAFRLLIECFPGHADGWNYLGWIAEERNELDEAVRCFETAVELGRKLFPKRIGKKSYWTNLDTRPYIRGLRNLAGVLNRTGRFEEALRVCERLDDECDDTAAAASFRAAVHLNLGLWKLAAEHAERVVGLWPEEGLVVAFARFELGEHAEALASFLHALLNLPRAVALVAGERAPRPTNGTEARDHNAGVAMFNAVRPYLKRSSRAVKFFRGVLRDPRVSALAEEVVQLEKRNAEEHASGQREAFDRLGEMRTRAFAAEKARALADLAASAGRGARARRSSSARPPDHSLN